MGIHVNIAEAKARLSELVAAAVRGEEVVLDRAGKPQVRLVALVDASAAEIARRAEKRKSAFGMYTHLVGDRSIDVRSLKLTDAEQEAIHDRKFGAAD
jgi:prevent-host-death family protein